MPTATAHGVVLVDQRMATLDSRANVSSWKKRTHRQNGEVGFGAVRPAALRSHALIFGKSFQPWSIVCGT